MHIFTKHRRERVVRMNTHWVPAVTSLTQPSRRERVVRTNKQWVPIITSLSQNKLMRERVIRTNKQTMGVHCCKPSSNWQKRKGHKNKQKRKEKRKGHKNNQQSDTQSRKPNSTSRKRQGQYVFCMHFPMLILHMRYIDILSCSRFVSFAEE